MAFQVSPSVKINEIDLTAIVPAVSSTEGAFAGVFLWGPIDDRQLLTSETDLRTQFGKPGDDNYESWLTAANFLSYSNSLWVARAASSNSYNAVANSTGIVTNTQIKNETAYSTNVDTLDANAEYFARYAGALGNSLKISVCDSANAFSRSVSNTGLTSSLQIDFTVGSSTAVFQTTDGSSNTTLSNTDLDSVLADLSVGDFITAGNSTIGTQYLKISSIGTVSGSNGVSTANVSLASKYYLSQDVTQTDTTRFWEYYNSVDAAPGTSDYVSVRGGSDDEMHIVVVDEDGNITGVAGSILEKFESISRATDAKGETGLSIYYKDVLENSSRYVYWANDRSGAPSALSTAITAATTDTALTLSFVAGDDGITESNIPLADMIRAYDEFKAAEEVDVSLIIAGKSSSTYGSRGTGLAQYIIEQICETRKDCIAFVAPQQSDVVNNEFNESEDTILTRNQMNPSSYAVFASNYKYMYDKYNDVNRWVNLSGDVAGLVARTDNLRDPWWSPGGYNRGRIKGVIKLAYNQPKAERDLLYKAGCNPILSEVGEGTLMLGDKTMLTKPSAFDRINVRRLFIVLEKAIASAAKFILFEFNDEFTQAQFRNLVEPYLRDVQGRRGIERFHVKCDNENNTDAIKSRNEFVADIFIIPRYSINNITLNFVAVNGTVQFDEVVQTF